MLRKISKNHSFYIRFLFAFVLLLLSRHYSYSFGNANRREQNKSYRMVTHKGKHIKLRTRIPEYNKKMLIEANLKSEEEWKRKRSLSSGSNIYNNGMPQGHNIASNKYTRSRGQDSLNKSDLPRGRIPQQDSYVNNIRLGNEEGRVNSEKDGEKVVYKRGPTGKNTITDSKNKSLTSEDINVKYYVEISSVKDKKRAEKVSQDIYKKINIPIDPYFDGSNYIIAIGPFFSRSDAIIIRSELKGHGYKNTKIVLDSM